MSAFGSFWTEDGVPTAAGRPAGRTGGASIRATSPFLPIFNTTLPIVDYSAVLLI